MTDAKKIQLETSLDTRPVKEGFQEIVQAAEGTATGVKNASDRAGKAVDGIGAGADAAAKKIEVAERSIIASIQRRTAAVQAAGQSESKYYEELGKQRGVNTDALRPYLQQLDAAKSRQDAASASLGHMGMSARATAAALRGVPAQFTDIFTSLQGGQQPLTVLLQQGGQLKDMFGGVGNAARAMGGYVAGLINPFTIALGIIGAVGVAAYKGAGELQAFNKSLILGGGQAGVSGDHLMAMAAGIDALSGSITQSKAAEALDEIVQAGVRGETQIKRYALAAAEFEAAGGGAAAEVAKQFAELGKDPLQASVKLTQSMGYLTAETYKQIKALEDQGRSLEAARVAQDAYASALEGKTPALMQNLGLIERGWNGVKNGAKEAWDAMLNIGRADTLSDQVSAVEKRLAAARTHQTLGAGNGFDVADPRRAADEALLDSLREQQRLAARAADMQATRAAGEKARISWMQEGDKYLSKEAQMEREITKIKAQGLAAGVSELEIEKRIAALREKNAKAPRKTREGDPFAADREAAKGWADAVGDFTKLAAEAEGKAIGLSKAQARLVEYLQSPAYKNASEPMRELALQQAYVAINAEQAAEALKKEQAAIEAAVNAMAGRIEGRQDRAAEIQEQVRQQLEATAAYGLSGDALLQLESARLMDAAAERERQAVIADGVDLSGMLGQAYRDEAQALRDLASAKQTDATVRKQRDAYQDLWKGVEGFAQNAFMDIAVNGEDAFKRIGESIKREILQMLYEMTVKKWIIQIAGNYGGMGGAGGNLLASAAQSTMTGGSALGSSGSALGSWATGGMSTSNMTGSLYANYTGGGMDALLASNSAYGTASGTTAGGAGASGIGWMGYAALIAAAIVVAENLYSRGYNRTALGYGPGETNTFGRTTFTSDPKMGRSWQYDYNAFGSNERLNRELLEMSGMSKKWADIFSGTTRMATLFGRKLGAYGYEAKIAGGDAEVGGFARYKGGLFRSNKTVGIDIDQRDAASVDAIVESTIEGARGMAKAMGYSSEAIDAYTGSIRVNMKNATTAEEQAKRMAEAMDDLQFSLLKAAAGGKYSREEFDKMMDGVRKSIEGAGISVDGLTGVLTNGIMNGLSGEEIGAQLSQMILGGIVQTFAQQAFAPVAQAMMSQIITPIFVAIAAGVPISQAVSKAAMQSIVQSAKQAMEVLNAIFNSAEMQEFFASLNETFGQVGSSISKVKIPNIGLPKIKQADTTAADTARERAQLEKELLALQGNTVELRRRELLELKPANRALQEQIWRLEDIKNTWGEVMDAISGEMQSLRDELLGNSEAARAAAMSEFTIATAAARAGDADAANRLPELAQAVADMAKATAGTLAQQQYALAYVFNSLDQTRNVLSSKYGLEIPKFANGGLHSGGARIVGEFEPELEVTGPARYWTARQTGQMLASGGAEVADAISKLADRMGSLEDRIGLVVVNTGSAARTLSDMQSEQQFAGASS